MKLNFKQKITITIVTGLFIVLASYVSTLNSKKNDSIVTTSKPVIVTGGSAVANGGNATSTVTVNSNVTDSRVIANGNSVVIIGRDSNVNVNQNQNLNNNSNVNIQINGQ